MTKKNISYIIVGIVAILLILFLIEIFQTSSSTTLSVPTDITEPTVTKNDATYGPVNATTTIVHFGYVGCEHCEDIQGILRKIADDTEGVKIVWKDYPNTSLAPDSLSAAIANRCAQEQDAFWEFQPFLFSNTHRLNDEFYLAVANDLELKERKFENCLNKARAGNLVQASINEGNALSVTATPTIFINGERFTGAMTEFNLRSLITE